MFPNNIRSVLHNGLTVKISSTLARYEVMSGHIIIIRLGGYFTGWAVNGKLR